MMTRPLRLFNGYFDWAIEIVDDDGLSEGNYDVRRLETFLRNSVFVFIRVICTDTGSRV